MKLKIKKRQQKKTEVNMKDVPFAVSKPIYVLEKKKEKQNLNQVPRFKTRYKNENSYG